MIIEIPDDDAEEILGVLKDERVRQIAIREFSIGPIDKLTRSIEAAPRKEDA